MTFVWLGLFFGAVFVASLMLNWLVRRFMARSKLRSLISLLLVPLVLLSAFIALNPDLNPSLIGRPPADPHRPEQMQGPA